MDLSLVNTEPFSGNNTYNNNKSWLACNRQQRPQIGLHSRLCMPVLSPNRPLEELMCKKKCKNLDSVCDDFFIITIYAKKKLEQK
jgi:hypothetical protein